MRRLLPAILILLLAIMALLLVIYQSVQRPPPLQYDRAVYTAERPALCPGEMLVYTNTLTISRASIVLSYISWFKGRGAAARPVFVPYDNPVPPRVFTQPVTIGPNRRENVIPKLPAGAYEFHFGASDGISLPATHVVLFSIRPGC